jgi:CPA1 family monovalent cation:H+ antiporter
MAFFELILGLLLAGALLTVVAQKIGVPYPSLLALAGAGLALFPSGITATLDPELALVLFVAPTLLDAAFDASPRDLKANWLPVSALVLVAVAVTVAGVAVVARLLVPGMPWPVAIVLGAIVAPPDASAATAVLRQLALPHRLMVILEGESLLNDASALLIYRVAIAVAGGMAFTFWHASMLFALTWVGGAALGVVLAFVYVRMVRPAQNLSVSVVTQFVSTFSVWILADRLGVSAILTTFTYAIVLARLVPERLGAEHRRASYAVWEVAVFVLNILAFILVGLQFRGVLDRLDGQATATAVFAGAVLLTVIVVRIAWVLGFTTFLRDGPLPPHAMRPPFKGSLVVAWCGMRGIVTLATALALPNGSDGGAVFPYRDLLVAAAFSVVLGTLVIQGMTLAPLLRFLKLGDDGALGQELVAARGELAKVAATAPADGAGLPAIQAQRRCLAGLRRRAVIGDNTFHTLEEELDWAEGHAIRRLRVMSQT